MAKPTYSTIPQRSNGLTYIDCEPHRATSWAVRKTERHMRATKLYHVSTILSRHDRKAEADLDRDHHERSHIAPRQAYKLGVRMGVRL